MGSATRHECPLCGREMTAIEAYAGRGELYCDRCDLSIGGNDAKTPEELTRLLSQRAGETCEYALEYDREEVERRRKAYEEEPYGLFPQSMPQECWTCSACGQQWKTHMRQRADGGYELAPPPEWMKCCPACGARITKVAMP